MKNTILISTALWFILPIVAADREVSTHILDIIIPENGFSEYLSLIKPRDTPQPSTATADAPKTWVDSASALFRYLNKNYTETGKLQYVTDPDNPQFLRMIAQHILDGTPLETKVGELTLEQQLVRVTERSTKSQQEIADTLRKVDAYRVPTHDGAKTMLHIVDSCYLALPNMHLIMAKKYLSLYIDTYNEDTLLNDNVLSELKFIPSLIAAHKQFMQDAKKAFPSPTNPVSQTNVPPVTPTKPTTPHTAAPATPVASSGPSPCIQGSAPIAIQNSGTLSRRGAPVPAPQTPAISIPSQTPVDLPIGTPLLYSSSSEGQTPIYTAQQMATPSISAHKQSAEYRERIRAKRIAKEHRQPNYIAIEPDEIELGTTYVAPITGPDMQLLRTKTQEQSLPTIEPPSSE